jgi:orotidine-5'-phosphate decarboxylase
MAVELTKKEQEARKRICLALDVPNVREALDLAEELSDYVGTFKVGKELHTVAGNERINIIQEIKNRGGSTFLDLKLHDTPNTVYGASKACSVPGVYMFNIHVAGGEEMCKKAIEGAEEGSRINYVILGRPKIIGVTVLTSLDDNDLATQNLGIKYDDLVRKRTELAREWGLDGIVCPANKAGDLEKEFGSDFTYVTPGIKWAGIQRKGQKQLYTPDLAVKDCSSSILVIGGAITQAEDKRGTAYKILQAMAKNL